MQVWIPSSNLPLSFRRLFHAHCTPAIHATQSAQMPFLMVRDMTSTAPFNYALKQCGAQVIPELTHPYRQRTPLPHFGSPKATLLDSGSPADIMSYEFSKASPDHAIDGDVLGAHCWEFDSRGGQLGFALVELLHISSISVDHNFGEGAQSAPRLMILWGVVDGDDALDRYAKLEKLRHRLQSHLPPDITEPMPSDNTYIPLAVMEYNPYLATTYQYFSVFREVKQFGFPIGIVVLQVLSNWGSSFTKLCHVGIHGLPVEEHEQWVQVCLSVSPHNVISSQTAARRMKLWNQSFPWRRIPFKHCDASTVPTIAYMVYLAVLR
jgi:hypothetical protein